MNAGLARLAFARSLPATWTLCAAALSLWLALDGGGATAEELARLPLELAADQVERALGRQRLWTGLLVLWLPALLLIAATTVPRWRREERDWLAPAAIGRGRLVVSTWFGGALAGALVLGACGVVAEAVAGDAPRAQRLTPAVEQASLLLLEGDAPRELVLEVPRDARTIRVPLVAVIGGAPPEVRLSARRAGGDEVTRVSGRVTGRRAFELALPPGNGAIELGVERGGPGAGIALSSGLGFVSEAASERLASVEVVVRAWLALAAWSALALGLGAWLSGSTAAAGVLALVVATWLSDAAPVWLPGRDLGSALAAVGAGFVPPALGASELIAAACCVALGLGLACAGLRSWRRA